MNDKELEKLEVDEDIEITNSFNVDQDTTTYLLENKCNAERLMKSIAQSKVGNTIVHELIEDES